MCLKLCHTDKNCLQGEICIDKFCRTGCNVDNDCRNGETCQNERCNCKKGFISTPQGNLKSELIANFEIVSSYVQIVFENL